MTWLLPALLACGGVILYGWSLQQWRLADHGGLADEEYRFLRLRYLRRSRASLLLAVLGVLLGWEPSAANDWVRISYWTGLGLLALGVLLLALQDGLANWARYARASAAETRERLQLQGEIERFRREQSGTDGSPTDEGE